MTKGGGGAKNPEKLMTSFMNAAIYIFYISFEPRKAFSSKAIIFEFTEPWSPIHKNDLVTFDRTGR